MRLSQAGRKCCQKQVSGNNRVVATQYLEMYKNFTFLAVHPKTGEVATSSVEERLRSFDAAWRRYDDCHYK